MDLIAQQIYLLRSKGHGRRFISKHLDISISKAQYWIRKFDEENAQHVVSERPADNAVEMDGFGWREMLGKVQGMQHFKKSISKSNYSPDIHLKSDQPICIVPLADFHIGSYGTDYSHLERITDELVNTPNLYAILIGDELDLTIKLRSIPEVFSGVMTPEQQVAFCESWMEDIKEKVIASIAGNHDLRAYQQAGINVHKQIFAKFVPYSPGIMHIRLHLNDIVYNIAGNHTFRGYSMYNKLHGQKRFSREQWPEGDIYLAGHTHQPAYLWEIEHNKEKLYINTGTLKINDEYAKSRYSIHTHPAFPCFVLYPNVKRIVPYPSVRDWLNAKSL